MTPINEHLDYFYQLLAQLEQYCGTNLLKSCDGKSISRRGVYFFFEPGELRSNGQQMRVVRVGTHAVSAGSKSTLWQRLRQHRGTGSGTGNHRGSIFRLHVGNALLNRDKDTLPMWGQKTHVERAIREQERDHERRVSDYIGNMPFLWLNVDDEPGKDSHRSVIERNSIALLSNQFNPFDPPSNHWLGKSSIREEIKRSGLWNLNYVEEKYDPVFLDRLEQYIKNMGNK